VTSPYDLSRFFQATISLAALALVGTSPALAQNVAPAPQAAQDAWNDDRVGMFVHWGLYSATDGAWNGTTGSGEWIQAIANVHSSDYANTLRPQFAPSANWATGIAQSAKAAGMKYVVVTAKHHDGFTLFNSNEHWSTGASVPGQTTNLYGGSNISPAGRDLMQELVDAVRAEGLKVGFYYSVIDWQHPNAYRGNNGLPTPASMFNGRTDENVAEPDPNAGSYKDYLYNHVEELMTNYGTIDELWFDYSSATVEDTDWNATALMQLARQHQPNIMINNRLYNGIENDRADLATPERNIPANGLPYNWETAQSWDNASWGYKSIANGADYKSVREAAMIISEAASKGGNTLLNVGPDRFGDIESEQATRMAGLSEWMAVNGEAIYETRASGIDASGDWGRMTMHKSADRYYAMVFNRPSSGVIDLASLDAARAGRRVAFSRLTSGGAVGVNGIGPDGSLAVSLNVADLDANQSATFRVDLGATWENLALNRPTSSSSVYTDDGLNLVGGLAVDGDKSSVTSGTYNFFHSARGDQNPWFEVDLGQDFRLGEIVLYNRFGFEALLRDITVEVFDENGQSTGLYSDLNDSNVLGGPDKLVVYLPDDQLVAGRRVRIGRASDGPGDAGTFLTLSEVEVFGTYLADATLDGLVDQSDLDILIANWGQTGVGLAYGDLTGDQRVDRLDLNLALAQWTGLDAPIIPPSIPEPSTAVLALVGIFTFASRSRRALQVRAFGAPGLGSI
jgi:alpha-L-fucosidase